MTGASLRAQAAQEAAELQARHQTEVNMAQENLRAVAASRTVELSQKQIDELKE